MPVNEQRSVLFLKPLEGSLQDQNKKSYASIEGEFRYVTIKHDEGNKDYKIKPYDALIIGLADEKQDLVLRTKIHINFSFSIASYLQSIKKGDYIKIQAKQGNDEKITFARVYKQDENGDFQPLEYEVIAGTETEKVREVTKRVTSHPCYSVPKTE